ncbi:MAG: 30S processome protein Utp24 [Thermoprotei archaeon]|nr:MAG: 30S processome protein Utp24 [Thermoprotei archaeon]
MGYCRGARGINRRTIEIVLDTNMLMLISSGINIFDQIEEKLAIKPRYVVLTQVIEELEKLAKKGKPATRKKAKFALEIVERYCKIVNTNTGTEYKSVDEAILEYALRKGAIVATNDKELRRKLRENCIPEIYIREESMRINIEGIEL